jgi:hypothetical protein
MSAVSMRMQTTLNLVASGALCVSSLVFYNDSGRSLRDAARALMRNFFRHMNDARRPIL